MGVGAGDAESWTRGRPKAAGEFRRPWPRARQADPDAALPTGDPVGDLQQSVAKLLRLGGGEFPPNSGAGRAHAAAVSPTWKGPRRARNPDRFINLCRVHFRVV